VEWNKHPLEQTVLVQPLPAEQAQELLLLVQAAVHKPVQELAQPLLVERLRLQQPQHPQQLPQVQPILDHNANSRHPNLDHASHHDIHANKLGHP
jgi:hypothetical protein